MQLIFFNKQKLFYVKDKSFAKRDQIEDTKLFYS